MSSKEGTYHKKPQATIISLDWASDELPKEEELALRFRYIYYDDFSRYENMPSEHRGIIAALKSGDSVEARRVVSEHIQALRAFVIEGGKTGFRDKREL